MYRGRKDLPRSGTAAAGSLPRKPHTRGAPPIVASGSRSIEYLRQVWEGREAMRQCRM